MLRVKRPIYFERFQKHIKDLERHLEEGDYVQAAEKVWGAISSFVNAYLPLEKRLVEEKREGFAALFGKLSVKYPSLKDNLRENNFDNPYKFASEAAGLHEYFYGGRRYKENQLRDILSKCAKVLKEIYKVVASRQG